MIGWGEKEEEVEEDGWWWWGVSASRCVGVSAGGGRVMGVIKETAFRPLVAQKNGGECHSSQPLAEKTLLPYFGPATPASVQNHPDLQEQ